MFVAAQYGDAERIRALAREGKPIDVPGPDGLTPLAAAVDGHHIEAAQALVALGANPNFRLSDGADLIMLAMNHPKHDPIEMLNFLVGLGLKVDTSTSDGRTALNSAISNHDERAVRRLIALGAKPNARTAELLQMHPSLPKGMVELIKQSEKRNGAS
jgi:uncharacterized protein